MHKRSVRIIRVVEVTLNVKAVCSVTVTRHSALHKAKRQSDQLRSCALVKSVDLSTHVTPPLERIMVCRLKGGGSLASYPTDIESQESSEVKQLMCEARYSRTPLIRINWNSDPCGYAKNTDNWIFL